MGSKGRGRDGRKLGKRALVINNTPKISRKTVIPKIPDLFY